MSLIAMEYVQFMIVNLYLGEMRGSIMLSAVILLNRFNMLVLRPFLGGSN